MWKKRFFIIAGTIGLLYFMPSHAQSLRVIDSLEATWLDKSMVERTDAFLNVALTYLEKDDALALDLTTQAEESALSSGDSSLIVMCWRIKGQILWKMGRTDEAVEVFKSTLQVAKRRKLDRDRMIILLSYGIALTFRSQYDAALRCLFEAQDLAVVLDNDTYYEEALHNIGLLFYKLKDYRKAIFYWKDASQYGASHKGADIRAGNISLCYVNLGHFDQARKYLEDAIQLCGEDCSDLGMIQITYASGSIYYGLKDYQSAEVEFLRSYRLSIRTSDIRMKLDNIYMLAILYRECGMIDQAFAYLNEAEKDIETGVPYNLEVIKIYSLLAELHLARGEVGNAVSYQTRYIALKDSIYDETLTTSLMNVEAEHLEEGHRAEVAVQREIISLKEKVIRNQRIISAGTGLLALLVLICAAFIYHSYLEKASLNRRLDQRVKERTAELELSYTELVSVLAERDALISKVTNEVVQTVKTISGLCGLGRTEVKGHVSDSYFVRIDQVANKLADQLGSTYSLWTEKD